MFLRRGKAKKILKKIYKRKENETYKLTNQQTGINFDPTAVWTGINWSVPMIEVKPGLANDIKTGSTLQTQQSWII